MSDDYEREAVEAFNAQEPVQDPHVQAAQSQWKAAEERHRNGAAAMDFRSPEQKREDSERLAKIMEDTRRAEEAKTERERMKRGVGSQGSGAPRQLVGRELGSVAMRAIEWLWVGWIPKGYITLFAGETGAGKSTIISDITSRVTTGAPWPGEYDCPNTRRKPERVMWLGSEDSIEEMTVPRLTACGANLANVVEIQGVMQEGKRNTFSMQDDLEAVAQWLTYARDVEQRPFAMLVIDPVTSYLPGQKLRKVDLNDAGQLRTVLEPWLILAQTFNIAIVCVTHFAKATDRSMLHRVLGSTAFVQTCRSLCAVLEPPRMEDEEPDMHAKVFMQVKMNLPEHPGGAWRFHTERAEVGIDHRNGKPIYATRPAWDTLDPALTPNSTVGKSRGPKSQYEVPFSMWMQAFFVLYPNHEWLPVSTIKEAALDQKVVSASWWDKRKRCFQATAVQGMSSPTLFA